MSDRALLQQALEALECLPDSVIDVLDTLIRRKGGATIGEDVRSVMAAPRARLAQPEQDWRSHVENRIRTWRQRAMNKNGDRLSIDDFMGQDSIDDLVDYVCDEYAVPVVQQAKNTTPTVAWRWIPTSYWREYVYTDKPELAEQARNFGIAVEELQVRGLTAIDAAEIGKANG